MRLVQEHLRLIHPARILPSTFKMYLPVLHWRYAPTCIWICLVPMPAHAFKKYFYFALWRRNAARINAQQKSVCFQGLMQQIEVTLQLALGGKSVWNQLLTGRGAASPNLLLCPSYFVFACCLRIVYKIWVGSKEKPSRCRDSLLRLHPESKHGRPARMILGR